MRTVTPLRPTSSQDTWDFRALSVDTAQRTISSLLTMESLLLKGPFIRHVGNSVRTRTFWVCGRCSDDRPAPREMGVTFWNGL